MSDLAKQRWHAVIEGPSSGSFVGHQVVSGDPESPSAIITDGVYEEEHAYLIAAAPDLLAACLAFLACPPQDRHDIALEVIVEEAVAKAKGE